MSDKLDAPLFEWVGRLLNTSIDHAVIFLDARGIVVGWTGAAHRLFGYTQEQALGLPFAAIFTPEDRALGLDEQEIALAGLSGRSEDDRWHVRKDASVFWASGVLQAIRDEQGNLQVFCKIVRDRTDVRTQIGSLQNQIAVRNAQAVQQNELLTSIAHELRNPLMPILSAVALIQKSSDDGLRSRCFEIIERQFGILRTLIEDLNDLSHSQRAAPSVTLYPLTVQDALRSAADSLGPLVEERQQVLGLVLPSGSIFVLGDDVRLQQMLANLIGNAIKYTPMGGRISLSATVEADMAVIRVEDNGIGIDPAVLPHIFDLFTRERRDSTTPGNGIGLAVVKELARLMNGGVEARSPGIGKGSVFAIRLPLAMSFMS